MKFEKIKRSRLERSTLAVGESGSIENFYSNKSFLEHINPLKVGEIVGYYLYAHAEGHKISSKAADRIVHMYYRRIS